uniref:Uncharacterized protein n=1 Tax=Tanacetum cinerariifolium TaxID=118510 RepID=A0A6L2J0Y3_TANCI|nr:hypothetical protein [Tanacetum cinerariifolium]
MDDPNITMEEYIRLDEEKAQRHGRMFNWQTATYGKVKYYEDEDDCFANSETEFPAIVFDETLCSTLMALNLIKNLNVPIGIPFDLKWYFKDGVYTRILRSLRRENERPFLVPPEPGGACGRGVPRRNKGMKGRFALDALYPPHNDGSVVLGRVEACFFSRVFLVINTTYMAPLPPRDQRHPWLRSVNRLHVLDFVGLIEGMSQTLAGSDTEMGLDVAVTLCFQLGRARHRMTWRGQAPEKVTNIDLFYMRIMDQGTANILYILARYLLTHTEGRKSGARLSVGHFIGELLFMLALLTMRDWGVYQ